MSYLKDFTNYFSNLILSRENISRMRSALVLLTINKHCFRIENIHEKSKELAIKGLESKQVTSQLYSLKILNILIHELPDILNDISSSLYEYAHKISHSDDPALSQQAICLFWFTIISYQLEVNESIISESLLLCQPETDSEHIHNVIQIAHYCHTNYPSIFSSHILRIGSTILASEDYVFRDSSPELLQFIADYLLSENEHEIQKVLCYDQRRFNLLKINLNKFK